MFEAFAVIFLQHWVSACGRGIAVEATEIFPVHAHAPYDGMCESGSSDYGVTTHDDMVLSHHNCEMDIEEYCRDILNRNEY